MYASKLQIIAKRHEKNNKVARNKNSQERAIKRDRDKTDKEAQTKDKTRR